LNNRKNKQIESVSKRHDKDIQTKLTEVSSTNEVTMAVVKDDDIEDGNIFCKDLLVDVDESTFNEQTGTMVPLSVK
jgi:hypothetical protein